MSDIDPSTGRRTATDKREHFRMTVDAFTRPGKFTEITDPVERMALKGLHASCVAEARLAGTDGHVDLGAICEREGLPRDFGKTLILLGLCHQADHGCVRCPQPAIGCEYVHDYLDHNRSAAQEQRTRERRRVGGENAARQRWDGHTRPAAEKRPPGRPRKDPAPQGPAADLLELAARLEDPAAAMHPAEARARAESGKRRPGRPKVAREFAEWVVKAAHLLADLIARNDVNGKRPNVTATWMNTIRLMHEVDHREIEKIQKAIEWSQTHHFYSTIILSPANLRKHFNAMHKRAIEDHQRGGPGAVRRVPMNAPARLPQDNSMFEDDYMPGVRR